MKKLYFFAAGSVFFSLHAQVYNITSYGAVGDSVTMNTVAIQAAIDSCSNHGGGTVEVPVGNFVTGTLFLKSNVIINLDSGGAIIGSSNLPDYPLVTPSIRSYADNYPQRSLFYAEGQNNIGIRGQGTFEGSGFSINFALAHDSAPMGFRFISCSNVIYDGVTLKNSGFWMMHNFNIDTLTIKNLHIVNQAWGNNDGIDIDGCRHVLVDSCFADCNDDAVVMKTTSPIGNDSIEIRNCTFSTYSRAIKIGTETFGPTSNVYVHDCVVQYSTQGPYGSHYPALCGINLAAVNGGSMQNITVENITMTGVMTAIFIRLGNQPLQYTSTVPPAPTGFVRNVVLNNITATVTSDTTNSVTGIPGYDLENISLQNIDITFPGGWSALDSSFVVPENIGAAPQATIFGDSLPAAGLYSRHVDSLQLINVCFHALKPDSRPDFWLDDVYRPDTSGICGTLTDVNIPTGIIEDALDGQLILFPNPTGGHLELKLTGRLTGGQIAILNIAGQVLRSWPATGTTQMLNVNDLSSGFYFVEVNGNGISLVSKFLKR